MGNWPFAGINHHCLEQMLGLEVATGVSESLQFAFLAPRSLAIALYTKQLPGFWEVQ